VLRFINLWAKARLTGNLFSWSRRREVLHALTRHLFFIFGGDSWERAEQSSIRLGADGLRQLQRAVSTRQVEAGLAESLTVECPALAQLPSEERIGRLASLARKFLHLPPRVHIVTRNTSVTLVRRQAQGSPDDPDWLCEFALRLASDPASALPWAGPSLTAAVKRLFDMPVLARAARFLVLAVDRHAEARPGVAGRPYAGWEWR